jgi:hypothetical protein
MTTVLYLAGAGRSGGTLIGKILGQHDQLLYVGEVRELWTPGLLVDRLCGCGERLMDCSFWQAVFASAYGGLTSEDARWMCAMRLQYTRTRQVLRWLCSAGWPEALKRFAERLERLYDALRMAGGKPVLIDASRLPTYGRLLQHIPSIDLRVVHLVRDARAVAFSWGRQRTGHTARRIAVLPRKAVWRASAEWLIQNWLTEHFWGADPARYYRLRYEDFVAQPRREVARLLDWLGCAEREPSFIEGAMVHLGIAHSAAGNSYRLLTGAVQLELDREWRDRMPSPAQSFVKFLTFPLLRKYGYLSNA